MVLRPCIQCGTPSTGSRCPTHRVTRTSKVRAGNPLGQAILARDNYECQIRLPGCAGRATVVDHVVPLVRGGGETMAELQAACRHCNQLKGGR